MDSARAVTAFENPMSGDKTIAQHAVTHAQLLAEEGLHDEPGFQTHRQNPLYSSLAEQTEIDA
eukprot:m.2806 g.2806  ORF g.2806 m.2806 type:complete len:63 (+) comp1082_c1_seq1:2-190(+)